MPNKLYTRPYSHRPLPSRVIVASSNRYSCLMVEDSDGAEALQADSEDATSLDVNICHVSEQDGDGAEALQVDTENVISSDVNSCQS